jgi:hypothetical protein
MQQRRTIAARASRHHQSVGDLRAEINGKRWPPSAKATVLAAALGALAVVIVPILPA